MDLYDENRLDKYENLQKKYDSDDDEYYTDESSDIRREANFRVIRLNAMVRKWKTIF